MNSKIRIGIDEIRKDSWDKVTGRTKYTGDFLSNDLLHARILTSSCPHGKIKSIDISEAQNIDGVQKIITGKYLPVLTGSVISDRPPIAKDKVRYYGEPVALVIAHSEHSATKAVNLIKIEYEPLPVVNSTEKALENNPVLIHENLANYYYPEDTVYPQANTNIADHIKIRKGNMDLGWSQSDIIINSDIYLPHSDHLSMETRNCQAEILPN